MKRKSSARRRGTAHTRTPVCVLLLVVLVAGGEASAQDEPLEARAESGPVAATVRITPPTPRIGDPLRLELEVVAEQGIELLMPEFGEALDRYAIVDFAPSEALDDAGRTIARQVYTLQPTRSGPQNVPPLLIEFVDRRPGRTPTPEDADAYELETQRLEFEVATVLTGDASLELEPPLGELGPLETPGPPLWPWLVAVGIAAAAGSPFVYRIVMARLAVRRRRSAYEVARAELDALLYGPRPTGDAIGDFYVSLSAIVRNYIEGRFGLHSPEQTTDEFLEALATSPDLIRSHQDMLHQFLSDADLVKFAHHVPDTDAIGVSIDLAQRFLEETRATANA